MYERDNKSLLHKILDDPEKAIPNFVKKFKTLNDFFYRKGIRLLERDFICTRVAMPFIFARDNINKEELAIIKVLKSYKLFFEQFICS